MPSPHSITAWFLSDHTSFLYACQPCKLPCSHPRNPVLRVRAWLIFFSPYSYDGRPPLRGGPASTPCKGSSRASLVFFTLNHSTRRIRPGFFEDADFVSVYPSEGLRLRVPPLVSMIYLSSPLPILILCESLFLHGSRLARVFPTLRLSLTPARISFHPTLTFSF